MTNVLVGALSLVLLALAPSAWADGNPRAAGGHGRPAAFGGVRISNDQWPDSSTLRSFADDAIRLERARTQEEEALALYKWIARVMTIGGSAHEGPPGHETYVLDTLKILNVYGNHWCDGQARLYETMWRALGRQSARLYIPMRHHTFVELWWRDTDGHGRWHALDVNNGWFVRNEQGWIASSEEIERNPLLVTSANQNLKMRTKGWLRTHQTPAPEHSMDLHIRRGERYALLWDNEGIYYVNPRTRASVSADNRLYWAADALGKIGDARAVPELIAAVRDPFEAVRLSAAVALGDVNAREAVPALSELVLGKLPPAKGYALFNPVDVGAARWMAARALGRIGDPQAVTPLVDALLQNDGDLGVFVAEALGDLGDRRAVPALLEAAEPRPEPALRGIVSALGRLGDARALPLLLDLLGSGTEDVRHAAAVALGQLRGQAAVAALTKASRDDPAQYVRESATAALRAIRGRE